MLSAPPRVLVLGWACFLGPPASMILAGFGLALAGFKFDLVGFGLALALVGFGLLFLGFWIIYSHNSSHSSLGGRSKSEKGFTYAYNFL